MRSDHYSLEGKKGETGMEFKNDLSSTISQVKFEKWEGSRRKMDLKKKQKRKNNEP